MDRVDVKVELMPVGRKELLNDRNMAESSHDVAMRVTTARERAAHRLHDTRWRLNAEVPGSELRRHWPPKRGALVHVERALERGLISARGVIKVIRVGWTIADLLGKDQPGADECEAALSFWLGVTR
jgi:magnesium chelatase family protein